MFELNTGNSTEFARNVIQEIQIAAYEVGNVDYTHGLIDGALVVLNALGGDEDV